MGRKEVAVRGAGRQRREAQERKEKEKRTVLHADDTSGEAAVGGEKDKVLALDAEKEVHRGEREREGVCVCVWGVCVCVCVYEGERREEGESER